MLKSKCGAALVAAPLIALAFAPGADSATRDDQVGEVSDEVTDAFIAALQSDDALSAPARRPLRRRARWLRDGRVPGPRA